MLVRSTRDANIALHNGYILRTRKRFYVFLDEQGNQVKNNSNRRNKDYKFSKPQYWYISDTDCNTSKSVDEYGYYKPSILETINYYFSRYVM